jgi:hypothetical protein
MFGYGVPIQEPKNKCRKVEKLEIPCNYHRTTILQTLFAIFFLGCYTQLVFFFSKVFALNHQILKPFGVILEFTLIGRQQGARHRRRLREFPGSHCGHWEILWIKRMVPGQRKEQRWGDGSPNEVVYQAKLELYAAKILG